MADNKAVKERCIMAAVELSGTANIVVRELTIEEVNDLWNEMTKKVIPDDINTDSGKGAGENEKVESLKLHIIDLMFQPSIPSEAIAISTGRHLDDLIIQYSPEELELIIKKVEEVNDRLKKMFARLNEVGREILTRKQRGKDLPTP